MLMGIVVSRSLMPRSSLILVPFPQRPGYEARAPVLVNEALHIQIEPKEGNSLNKARKMELEDCWVNTTRQHMVPVSYIP